MKSIVVACLTATLLIPTSLVAADFRVKVEVSADGPLKDEVESFLNKTLRALPDVELVEGSEDWFLSVVVAPLIIRGGSAHGYILSTFVGTTSQAKELLKSLKYYFKDSGVRAQFDDLGSGLYVPMGHYVQAIDAQDLELSCRQVARDFNMNQLEAARRERKAVR